MKFKKFLLSLLGIFTLFLNSCTLDEPINSEPTVDHFSTFESIITLPNGNILETKAKGIFYEGDICLTEGMYENLLKYDNIFGEDICEPFIDRNLHPVTNLPISESRNLGVYPNGYNLWAMVRFVYDSKLTYIQKEAIKKALIRIQSNTNVRFYNATGLPTSDPTYGDIPYIFFTPIGSEDTSYCTGIGKQAGKQDIGFANFAFEPYNIQVIEHEICHALGMMHEQCRNDRDNYVIVDFSNLTTKGKANFAKQSQQYFIRGDYDFNSIMGYSSYTSSRSMVLDTNKPMYTKKDGAAIHQGNKLSELDRKWLNYFYLPYIARSDTYLELADTVYDGNNRILTPTERLQLQTRLNNGKSTPPANGRIPNEF